MPHRAMRSPAFIVCRAIPSRIQHRCRAANPLAFVAEPGHSMSCRQWHFDSLAASSGEASFSGMVAAANVRSFPDYFIPDQLKRVSMSVNVRNRSCITGNN
jgi:hypothetical protein